MMGCGFPDHEQGYNIARNAALLAGIDHHVPAVTVNRFCASSLQTIRMAFHAIKAGEGDQYIAAGVECTSRGAGMTLPVMNPLLDGYERHRLQRLHPDGADGRERGRALQGHAAKPRTSGRCCLKHARSRRARAATSTPRSSGWTYRRPTTPGETSSPRTRSREMTDRARARRWRGWRSSSPPSSPVAR